MLKVKSWSKLILSIVLAQSAGFMGTIFTMSAIPNWYVFLNKPTFSPPNWLFGPVWTILYTLIGISFYRIWIKNKKGSLGLFFIHLFLNALWSPIFFGLKNLGLAFVTILIMDITLIMIIKKFHKIDKLASYLLIPYLFWISFASLLNFYIWKLNPNNTVKYIFAQDFTFSKAREDFVFTEDNYKKDLFDFNLKKGAYQKNPTLSIKEDLRASLYKFIGTRNNLFKNYLTMIRLKTVESTGVETGTRELIYSKIDPEVLWFDSRKNNYTNSTTLEDLINKSKEEDSRFETDTMPVVNFTLAHLSLGNVIDLKNEHLKIYSDLKKESEELTKLGRADAGLFDRWFQDIENELKVIASIEKNVLIEVNKTIDSDPYKRQNGYKKSLETLNLAEPSLLKLNGFIKELESVIANKR